MKCFPIAQDNGHTALELNRKQNRRKTTWKTQNNHYLYDAQVAVQFVKIKIILQQSIVLIMESYSSICNVINKIIKLLTPITD